MERLHMLLREENKFGLSETAYRALHRASAVWNTAIRRSYRQNKAMETYGWLFSGLFAVITTKGKRAVEGRLVKR